VSDPLEVFGESFDVAERIGLMPMMRFAKAAKSGLDSADMDGLAAMYDLLEQCIAEKDWARFERAADRARADGDELMGVVTKVMELLAERPTPRSSDSSDGPSIIEPTSTVAGSSSVIDRLEKQGRPDLALLVTQARAS
jgi:uncharacterized protein with von Willebrand factor type A (vWA) domain